MLTENQISFDKNNVFRCLKCNSIPLFGINYLNDNKVLIEYLCNNNHCDNIDIFQFFNKYESKLYSNKNFDFINNEYFYCLNCQVYIKKNDLNSHDKNHNIKSLKDFDNINLNECKITMENCKNCLTN